MKPILCLLFFETIYKLLSGNRLGFKKKKKYQFFQETARMRWYTVLEELTHFTAEGYLQSSPAEVNPVPRTEAGDVLTISGSGQPALAPRAAQRES